MEVHDQRLSTGCCPVTHIVKDKIRVGFNEDSYYAMGYADGIVILQMVVSRTVSEMLKAAVKKGQLFL
jgi:hypothetical protein